MLEDFDVEVREPEDLGWHVRRVVGVMFHFAFFLVGFRIRKGGVRSEAGVARFEVNAHAVDKTEIRIAEDKGRAGKGVDGSKS